MIERNRAVAEGKEDMGAIINDHSSCRLRVNGGASYMVIMTKPLVFATRLKRHELRPRDVVAAMMLPTLAK